MVQMVRRTRRQVESRDVIEVHATAWESPVGRVTLAVRDEGIVWIGRDADPDDEEGAEVRPRNFVDEVEKRVQTVRWVWEDEPDRTAPALDGLRRYFDGDPDSFETLPIAPVGTPFQLAVWEACARIPYAETVTYGELALMSGRPGAARAVGGAMNRNPIPFVIPCHRVVGAGGDLVGYGMGGLGVKRWLLDHEMRTRHH